MITEQDGQTIVDKLRPMSEAPRSNEETVFLFMDDGRFDMGFWNQNEEGWETSPVDVYEDSIYIGWLPLFIYKPKKAEAFHQKDVPGRLREISGVDEARDLGESAAKCMAELMQIKEGG